VKILITLLLISLTLQAPLSWSQNRIPTQILVEKLSDEPCGLTEDAVAGRATLTLRQYGFTKTESSNPYFYIAINSLELGQQCVGDITVEVTGYDAQDFGGVGMGWVSKAKTRETDLASASAIFSYPRYAFPSMALDSVEAQIKKVLGKIEY